MQTAILRLLHLLYFTTRKVHGHASRVRAFLVSRAGGGGERACISVCRRSRWTEAGLYTGDGWRRARSSVDDGDLSLTDAGAPMHGARTYVRQTVASTDRRQRPRQRRMLLLLLLLLSVVIADVAASAHRPATLIQRTYLGPRARCRGARVCRRQHTPETN